MKLYFAFCDRHSGYNYTHHNPTMTDVLNHYDMTLRKYNALFTHNPKDQNMWPTSEVRESEKEGSSYKSYDDIDGLGCG